MNLALSKSCSSLIKNSGAQNAPRRSAQNAPRNAKRIEEIRNLGGFVKTPSRLLAELGLSPADKILWQAVERIQFHFKVCIEPLDVIAGSCGLSKRQAVNSVAKMLELGWMEKKPSPRHNVPDELVAIDITAPVVAIKKSANSAKCARCARLDLPITAAGICVDCRAYDSAKKAVKTYLDDHGASVQGDVYSDLKMENCKSRPADLKKAYDELIGNYISADIKSA